jgi:hypothetical protein
MGTNLPDMIAATDPAVANLGDQQHSAHHNEGRSRLASLELFEADHPRTAHGHGPAHGAANLTATGTRDASTYLRGDNTWAVPPSAAGRFLADYVLYRDGATYFARSGATGTDQFSGPDAGAVLASVIGALGTAGGLVGMLPATYAWGSVPAVPAGVTGRLTIQAQGRAVVALSADGPRFLDPASTGSTQNVTLDGIVVDAGATAGTAAGQHLLFGNVRAGALYTGISFKGIRILGCKVLNGRVGTDGTTGHNAVYLATQHDAAGQPQSVVEDIIVDDLTVTGCLYGVTATAFKVGTWTGEPDIWMDNITVRNIYHHLGSVPPGFTGSAHVHIGGSKGQVGRVTVENVYGYGSRDVGIEINNFQDATVENVTLEEYNGYAVYFTNHRPIRRTRDQHAVARNVHGRHLAANGAKRSNSCSVVAVSPVGSTVIPVGSVDVEGGSYYSDVPSITGSGLAGIAIKADHEMRSFSLEDFESHLVGINHTDAAAANPRPFYIAPRNTTAQIRFSRVLSVAEGTAAAGAGAISLYHFDINGLAVLDIADISARMDITGAADFGHRMMQIGNMASTIKGTIRRPKVLSAAATQPRGIVVLGTATLTIPNEIRVVDADFAGMPSPSIDIAFGSGVDMAKIRLEGIKWRVGALPPVGVAVGASPWVYQALQGYRETLIVSGGTVSLIEFSRDGTTWFGLGETAGMFVLDPADRLRITHTAAPVVTRIPAK